MPPEAMSPDPADVNPGETLHEIAARVEAINAWLPWGAMGELHSLEKEMKALRPSYGSYLRRLTGSLLSPRVVVKGQAFLSVFQAEAIGALIAWQTVQNAWHEVDTAIDRKQAWSLGVLSLYIALVALLLSIWPLACGSILSLPDPPMKG